MTFKPLHNPSSHAALDFSLELANDKQTYEFLNSPSLIKINCVIYAPTAICSYSYYGLYFILPFTRVSCLCP